MNTKLNATMKQVFAQNREQIGGGFQVKNEAEGEATVLVYDAIGAWFGIDPADFNREFSAIQADKINLRINSPGGSVFDARAMITTVQQHSATVTAHIDGVAASAATGLALAADEVVIAEGGFFMIHNAWGMAIGDADEMRATAELLDKINVTLAADYTRKTGLDQADVLDLMSAETWYTGAEAVEAGFADRIAEGQSVENAARWNLEAYENSPKALTEKQYDRAGMERRLALLTKVAA